MHTIRIRSLILVSLAAAALGGPLSGVAHAVATAPTATAMPSITGTAQSGKTLTVTPGGWDPSATTTSQDLWVYCSSSDPSSCNASSPAAGTTSGNSYNAVDGDVGKYVAVIETATNTDSSDSTTATATATSNVLGPIAAAPTPAPTTRTPALAISGTAAQGATLSANAGSWDNSPTSTTDQWYDCPTNSASGCTAINGANGQTYTVQSTDVGQYIYLTEFASNASGPSPTVSSNLIGPIVGPPVNTTLPQITGTLTIGANLTTDGGAWTNSPTLTYQWQRCAPGCSNITSAGNAATYKIKTKDAGATLQVVVTATNAAGTASATSPQTAVIAPVPVNTTAPGITGTTQISQTLTETAGTWTNSPTSTTVQWYRCGTSCTAIAGATGKTYALTTDDLGAEMQVSETATNSGGSATAYSALAGPVVNAQGVVPPPALSGSVPTISGNTDFGSTLTASGAHFSNNPNAYSYQWLRCGSGGCVPIGGANTTTYALSDADVGSSIAFTETASNSGGSSSTATSGRTATVTTGSGTTLRASTGSPVAGQSVTLIASVTPAGGSIRPNGTIDFRANGSPIAGCTGLAVGSGSATAICVTSFVASHPSVGASYSAVNGAVVRSSSSAAATLDVGQAPSSTSVATSAHASLGSKTVYTASVRAPSGSSLKPTGKITFLDGKRTIHGCGGEKLTARGSSCSVKYLGLGRHKISARYGGDANFAASTSVIRSVTVQPQTPHGFVSVFMNWTFAYSLHSTRIKTLSAFGLARGIHLSLSCSGTGCPFVHRSMTVSAPHSCRKGVAKGCAAAPSVNLTPVFHRAHLHVGTTLTVAITHRGWVGKYYRFKVRSGKRPAILVSCLAVDGTRPGVGCSAS